MSNCFQALGSVDPPGVVQYLDPIFTPRSARYSSKELFYVASLPGFTSLPRQLVPDGRRALQPPVYLYGWEIDRAKLGEYAEENNLREFVEKTVWLDEDEDEDDDKDEDEDEDEDEPKTRIIIAENESRTMLNVMYSLAKDVGLRLRPQCPLGSVLAQGTMVSFFALYSNYQLANAPLKTEIAALQDHLRACIGETEPPKWLPDDEEFQWRQLYLR
ncbi:hypothetical protein PHLCEN_2v4906 [Hermanssonia centrifuga]|uniref:Uncharacterized protein n=1 Tax=Hermanssonia centrifuga TaxID=98765 RepID=A0A2R6PG89_9APHY|nr:hypothetical protein PHLCEN_2v4906 [Hermanssonia centrifuga]